MKSESFYLDMRVPGTVVVTGTLGFATAVEAHKALGAALNQGAPRYQLDLAGLQTCDSAGLACVLAVLADAANQGRMLRVLDIPTAMRVLAQISGVEAMLDQGSRGSPD